MKSQIMRLYRAMPQGVRNVLANTSLARTVRRRFFESDTSLHDQYYTEEYFNYEFDVPSSREAPLVIHRELTERFHPSSVLDVGCGPGEFLKTFFSTRASRATGLTWRRPQSGLPGEGPGRGSARPGRPSSRSPGRRTWSTASRSPSICPSLRRRTSSGGRCGVPAPRRGHLGGSARATGTLPRSTASPSRTGSSSSPKTGSSSTRPLRRDGRRRTRPPARTSWYYNNLMVFYPEPTS